MEPSTSPIDDDFHGSTNSSHHHHHHPKRRRTKRLRSSTASSSRAGVGAATINGDDYSTSSTATQSDDHDMASNISPEEEDMANCLILLSQGIKPTSVTDVNAVTNAVYECKTCNRVFPSFQALGGHRASHRKPKPNSIPTVRSISPHHPHHHDHQIDDQDESIINNNNNNNNNNNMIVISKVRVHECSICGSEFPSGQALGGHMRRHRAPQLPAPSSLPDRPIETESSGSRNVLPLDLNLPAPDDDEIKFHVFPTPALVDCHY